MNTVGQRTTYATAALKQYVQKNAVLVDWLLQAGRRRSPGTPMS